MLTKRVPVSLYKICLPPVTDTQVIIEGSRLGTARMKLTLLSVCKVLKESVAKFGCLVKYYGSPLYIISSAIYISKDFFSIATYNNIPCKRLQLSVKMPLFEHVF